MENSRAYAREFFYMCKSVGMVGQAEVFGGRIPTDELTGLPHAILPVELGCMESEADRVNYHHHFFNRRHPDLEGTYRVMSNQLENPEEIPLPIIAGYAVRISRGQLLPIGLHQLTHKKFPTGPVLPHTVDEKFVTAVKACSGVVSRWALDVAGPAGPRLVYMDDDLFEQVASPRLLCTERVYHDKPADHRRKILGSFFLRYAASQNVGDVVSGSVIDTFLYPRDEEQRRAAGNFILREAMNATLDPVEQQYIQLKRQGHVQPGRPGMRAAVWKYVHPDRRGKVYGELAQQLLAAA